MGKTASNQSNFVLAENLINTLFGHEKHVTGDGLHGKVDGADR